MYVMYVMNMVTTGGQFPYKQTVTDFTQNMNNSTRLIAVTVSYYR